jgi:hypothetical protein
MTSLFPLYDRLEVLVAETPPKTIEHRKLCSIIHDLPMEHREMIHLLLLHDEAIKGSGVKTWRSNPYKGKTFEGGQGVLYNMTYFPSDLIQKLVKYIELITE